MRQGLSKAGILRFKDKFFGFCLGADFCAEHEWGIDDLKQDFGIKGKNIVTDEGIKRLQFQHVNEKNLLYFEKGKSTYLLYLRYGIHGDLEKFKDQFHRSPSELYLRKDDSKTEDMAGAWSGRDFGIHVIGQEHRRCLKKLYEAILAKDAAFCFTGSLPAFDNAGLCIVMVSAYPEEFDQNMVAQQREKMRLAEAADKTGLIAYLDSKGKGSFKSNGYMACSPKFATDTNRYKDGIMWWLNPNNQQEDTHGWFTTQELKDWADNKPGNLISGKGYRYQKR